MPAASVLFRRAALLACALLIVVPLHAQDDDDGDGEDVIDPMDPYGGTSVPGQTDTTERDAMQIKKREWTSSQLLRWEWDQAYAPNKPGAPPLSVKAALALMAGHDERPLLLVRECEGCKRDDHTLVEKALTDDRVILYARWYHPIRVEADVIKKTHPFHALFDGNSPAHLVVTTVDGSLLTELGARANQQQSWKVLSGVLRKAYKKDPEAAVKNLLLLLDDFDRVDKELAATDNSLNEMRAAKTTEGRDFKALEERRAALDKERTALLAKGKTLDDLGLKTATPAPGG